MEEAMNATTSRESTHGVGRTRTLTVDCPFCGNQETIAWDGLYRPRYFDCGVCGERYVYEPLADSVLCRNPTEVPCCDDPECREYETLGHCEQ